MCISFIFVTVLSICFIYFLSPTLALRIGIMPLQFTTISHTCHTELGTWYIVEAQWILNNLKCLENNKHSDKFPTFFMGQTSLYD